uniref:hypothetical protein n=1 Tax=Capnocytophaga granulosa TaxID=45242 RepID=UPI0023F3532B
QNSGTLGKDTINNWIIPFSLREFLESKEIIANIKPNPQNGEQPDVYFDEELYKIGLKLNKQMVGLTDIKV